MLMNSIIPRYICHVLAKSASKFPRYKAFESDTPGKILPYEFIRGQVSPATLNVIRQEATQSTHTGTQSTHTCAFRPIFIIS